MSVAKKGSKAVDVETCCLSAAVPAYLRFDAVKLDFESLESWEQMKLHLQHFKNALIGAKFSITCCFEYNRIEDSSMFLECFVKAVLPITDASQSYAFKMDVSANLYYEFDVDEMITGLMAALVDCSDLSFDFDLEKPRKWREHGFKYICLPYNQISDWLARKTHQQSGKKGEQNVMKERSLSIFTGSCRLRNYTKMSKCVEKVANNAFSGSL